EDELRAKILKDFIRMGLESGDFKPEIWSAPVLKLYLNKLGISAEKWIEVADDEDIPQEARERVALFGVLANAVDLDSAVYHKYTEALKAIRQDAEVRWENHEFWYIRTEIGSTTYMEGLAAGYKVV